MIEALASDRLTLEPLVEDHAAEMVSVLADPGLYEFTGGEPPDLDDLQQRYRAQVAGSSRPGETWLNWILRARDSACPVGYVQATVTDGAAEVAWLIGVEHQGRRYASEATGVMAAWLKASGVNRLVAHIHPAHVVSQRVAAGLGLSRTGEVDADGEELWSG